MKSTLDESRAADFLRHRGLRVEGHKTASHKTPDFDVEAPGGLFFFVEVKSIRLGALHAPILWDTIYNNITADLAKAAKQFDAVNDARFVD